MNYYLSRFGTGGWLLAATLLSLAGSESCTGQGTLALQDAPTIGAAIYDIDGATPLAGPAFLAQVYAAPVGDTSGGDWNPFSDIAYGAGKFIMVGERGYIWNLTPRYFGDVDRAPNGAPRVTVTGGDLGRAFHVQAATDLSTSNWVDLVSLTNTGLPPQWLDSGCTNFGRRFYRVLSP